VRIARRDVESSERLGRHRWVVERTLAWLNRYRRLRVRYERRADIHEAFLYLGCSLICLNYLSKGVLQCALSATQGCQPGRILEPRKGGGRPPKIGETMKKLLEEDVKERPAAAVSHRRSLLGGHVRFLEDTMGRL
jgi:hypothetical protein